MFETFLKTLEKTVKPLTLPVATKFIKDGSLLTDAKIKLKNRKIAICQQIAYSRYYGWSTYVEGHYSYCVLGASNCGLIKTPERVLEGHVNCSIYQKDLDAAKSMQASMPRVKERFQGFLTYPLTRPVEGIEPDVIVVYVNTAQAMRFVQAFLYHRGGEFIIKSSGDAGVCSRCVVEAFNTKEPKIEIPCLGDRRFAMTQDFELAVGIPYVKIDEVIEGLEATHKAGIRYPIPFDLKEECSLPKDYTTFETD
ncbi:hypothetical protein FHQ18_07475 [Deferribacter autotrophicus]|uniref:DUF169 domain-containing protein n=1 Tax=Deferribacter autotrophicus TaxID=500465 RepID=A0A5A8F655_9BACT|nr:DUF169 domain-containing protein [Deferribacter autotrophicus]KAA0258224.1 hypothetical protein FHQ18_07475 [Deferribacter autotrophicus]